NADKSIAVGLRSGGGTLCPLPRSRSPRGPPRPVQRRQRRVHAATPGHSVHSRVMAIDSTHGPGQQPGGDDTAQQLARCRAELASVEREFEQFAYGVSHDLRAPLRTIESFGTLLRRELGEDAPPKVQDHLERVLAA